MVQTKCEIYSRVVGYIRPVEQWNDGKQAEFKDRSLFFVKKQTDESNQTSLNNQTSLKNKTEFEKVKGFEKNDNRINTMERPDNVQAVLLG